MRTHATRKLPLAVRSPVRRRLPSADQSLGHHSSGNWSVVRPFVARSYTRYADPRERSLLNPCSQRRIRRLSEDQRGRKLDPVVPQTRGTVVRSSERTRDWITSHPRDLSEGGSCRDLLKVTQRPSGEIAPAPFVIESSRSFSSPSGPRSAKPR